MLSPCLNLNCHWYPEFNLIFHLRFSVTSTWCLTKDCTRMSICKYSDIWTFISAIFWIINGQVETCCQAYLVYQPKMKTVLDNCGSLLESWKWAVGGGLPPQKTIFWRWAKFQMYWRIDQMRRLTGFSSFWHWTRGHQLKKSPFIKDLNCCILKESKQRLIWLLHSLQSF